MNFFTLFTIIVMIGSLMNHSIISRIEGLNIHRVIYPITFPYKNKDSFEQTWNDHRLHKLEISKTDMRKSLLNEIKVDILRYFPWLRTKLIDEIQADKIKDISKTKNFKTFIAWKFFTVLRTAMILLSNQFRTNLAMWKILLVEFPDKNSDLSRDECFSKDFLLDFKRSVNGFNHYYAISTTLFLEHDDAAAQTSKNKLQFQFYVLLYKCSNCLRKLIFSLDRSNNSIFQLIKQHKDSLKSVSIIACREFAFITVNQFQYFWEELYSEVSNDITISVYIERFKEFNMFMEKNSYQWNGMRIKSQLRLDKELYNYEYIVAEVLNYKNLFDLKKNIEQHGTIISFYRYLLGNFTDFAITLASDVLKTYTSTCVLPHVFFYYVPNLKKAIKYEITLILYDESKSHDSLPLRDYSSVRLNFEAMLVPNFDTKSDKKKALYQYLDTLEIENYIINAFSTKQSHIQQLFQNYAAKYEKSIQTIFQRLNSSILGLQDKHSALRVSEEEQGSEEASFLPFLLHYQYFF